MYLLQLFRALLSRCNTYDWINCSLLYLGENMCAFAFTLRQIFCLNLCESYLIGWVHLPKYEYLVFMMSHSFYYSSKLQQLMDAICIKMTKRKLWVISKYIICHSLGNMDQMFSIFSEDGEVCNGLILS